MSRMQKGFSIGSIVTGLMMTVLLGVFSWLGNQTFENSKDKERIMAIMNQQLRQATRLVKSIDKLNETIDVLNRNIQHNREDIIRLQEWYGRDRQMKDGR